MDKNYRKLKKQPWKQSKLYIIFSSDFFMEIQGNCFLLQDYAIAKCYNGCAN